MRPFPKITRCLLLLSVLSFFSLYLHSQDLQHLNKNSYYTYIYKVPADMIFRINDDSDDFDPTLSGFRLIDSFSSVGLYSKSLPVGYYFEVKVEDRKVAIKGKLVTDLIATVMADYRNNKLIIRTKAGEVITDAVVTYRKKQMRYDRRAGAYILPFSSVDGRVLSIEARGEKVLYEYSTDEKEERDREERQERRLEYKDRQKQVRSNGYIVFNKPQYLPGDTVKLKAYLLHKNNRPYTTPLEVRVKRQYSDEKKYVILAEHIAPVTPGAYVFEFVVRDSFDIDRSYDLSFADRSSEKQIMGSSFRVEDYLLDKYTYEFKVDKKNWDIPIDDTIRMTATGKDQNDMNIMDGRVCITATASGVSKWNSDYECIPDTLFVIERKLSATGETRLSYPLEWLPNVKMHINLQADFINSAFEHQYKSAYVEIDRSIRHLEIQQFVDSIFGDVRVAGRSIATAGWLDAMDARGEVISSRAVLFPVQMRLDAFVDRYQFRAFGADTLSQSFQPGGYPYLRYYRNDSSIIFFPDRSGSPLYYTLYHGNSIVRKGALTTVPDTMIDRSHNEYKVIMQAIQHGDVRYSEYMIGVPSDRLTVAVKQSEIVYPGKKDSVSIHVTNKKGQPIAAANVTALSYNDKFDRLYLPLGGYYRKTNNPDIRKSDLEPIEDVARDLDLGMHPYWIRRAGLDTMPYYQLIFAGKRLLKHITPAYDLDAQFAPFIFDHGRSVKIHMILVDGALAYYDGAAGVMPYSIPVSDGRHHISLRTTDRMVHLDDVYLHNGVKNDLIIEWDSVRTNTDTMPTELTAAEKRMLQQNFIYYKQQRYNDTVYFWQNGSRYVFGISPYYTSTSSPTPLFIPIGPFNYEEAKFYVPHNFTTTFDPERFYAFSFTPGVARLERVDPFATDHIWLREYATPPVLRFGELLYPHPAPELDPRRISAALYSASYMFGYRSSSTYASALSIVINSDSAVSYLRIFRTDSMDYDEIFTYDRSGTLAGLRPGTYNVAAITASGYSYLHEGVAINPYSNCHIIIRADRFKKPQTLRTLTSKSQSDRIQAGDSALLYIPAPGRQEMVGRVCDSVGLGLQTVHVTIWDAAGGPVVRSTITDRDGYYSFPGLRAGSYVLAFQYTGYRDRVAQNVFSVKDRATYLAVRLSLKKSVPFEKNVLNEVTIIAYKRPLIDRAETKIEQVISSYERVIPASNLAAAIARTPGILATNRVVDEEVQYIVNGHRVIGQIKQLASLSVENIASSAAGVTQTDIGGSSSRGDIISQVFLIDPIEKKYEEASKLRTSFRDYAYWQPNLITDDSGEAKFVAQYPDNIVSWRSYAIAMNKKHHIGVRSMLTRSFKECMAEMALPKFLIAGDSSAAAIKITDYLVKPIPLTANFIWDGKKTQENDVVVNDILTDNVPITVAADEMRKEIKTSFNISTKGGFGDGEERTIAILPQGTEETRGSFSLLRGDTSLTLPLDTSLGQVTVRAESDILDVLLDEIDHVRKYPYWCMEQTASRLVMLSMLEKINTSLGKPFKFQKERKACITKLEKGQLPSGAYGWWEYSPASVRLTTYVLSALAKANAQVNGSYNLGTKDGYRYLDEALPLMSRDEKLNTLELFADRSAYRDLFRSKADPDLSANVLIHLPKIPFDSLSLHQRMQYYKIELMMARADTFHHWDSILAKKQQTIFGGAYWGEDNWYWYSNQVSTTVLAYEIAELKKDTMLQEEVIQYFLEKRNHNGWRNTSESAKIVSAILPKILSDRKGDLSAPSVNIDGIGPINSFPYTHTFTPTATSTNIAKRGGVPVYFTAYQKVFNSSPKAVSKDFEINTTFKRSNIPAAILHSGESSEIVVNISTKKYCEYLMIEIPIPAGCTYGPKPQSYGYTEVHREYFKDKVVIFCEAFQPGHQEFHIPIESRYKGSYTVNPAKVQLMYFPTFFGRNDIKRISIK